MTGTPRDGATTSGERVFTLERLRIGRFRREATDPSFRDSGPIGGWLVVFPRTSVWIQHAGKERVLADPSRAMLYNAGQEYTRASVGGAADRCEWFSYAPEVIAEAMARFDPAAMDRVARPFTATHAPIDAPTYALQRRVFEHVTRVAEPVDPLFVEEASLAVLARVTEASAGDGRTSAAPARAKIARQHAALTDDVRTFVGSRAHEPLSLAAIAGAVGRSPFHVARVFRAQAGTSVHAYLTLLRLRISLERVAAGEDLTTIAFDLGFSSHSHFTRAFAKAFGEPPRAFRAAAASSKKMKAAAGRDRAR